MLRTAYALIVNSGLTGGLGLIFWALAARLYPASALGHASSSVNALMFLGGVCQLNLLSFLSRFLPELHEERGRLIVRCYVIASALSAFGALVYLAVVHEAGTSIATLGGTRWLAPVFFVTAVAWAVFSLQDAALTGLRAAEWVPLENALFGVAKIALLFPFVSSHSALGIFAPWTIGALIAIPPINYLIFRRLLCQPSRFGRSDDDSRRPLHGAARFIAGDYVATVLSYGNSRLIPVIFISLAGATTGAYFAIGWMIATTLDVVSMNVATSLTVEGAAAPQRLPELLRRAARHGLTITVACSLAVALLARPILAVFGKGYAHSAQGLLILMAMSCVPRSVVLLAGGLYRVRNQTSRIAVMNALLFATTLTSTLTLHDRLGITAPAWGWLAGQSIAMCVVGPPLLREARRAVR